MWAKSGLFWRHNLQGGLVVYEMGGFGPRWRGREGGSVGGRAGRGGGGGLYDR